MAVLGVPGGGLPCSGFSEALLINRSPSPSLSLSFTMRVKVVLASWRGGGGAVLRYFLLARWLWIGFPPAVVGPSRPSLVWARCSSLKQPHRWVPAEWLLRLRMSFLPFQRRRYLRPEAPPPPPPFSPSSAASPPPFYLNISNTPPPQRLRRKWFKTFLFFLLVEAREGRPQGEVTGQGCIRSHSISELYNVTVLQAFDDFRNKLAREVWIIWGQGREGCKDSIIKLFPAIGAGVGGALAVAAWKDLRLKSFF